MKNGATFLILGALIASCNDTYVNHKIGFKKIGDCETLTKQYQLESNIMGDRFVFNECLPENFDEKGYSVDRKGDTLIVSFTQADNQPKKGFELTLDIDANPPYSHIKLGSEVLVVGHAE